MNLKDSWEVPENFRDRIQALVSRRGIKLSLFQVRFFGKGHLAAIRVTPRLCYETCHLASQSVPVCDRPIILSRSDNLEGSTSPTAITSKSSE